MNDLPYYNPLTLAIRRAIYGDYHPLVMHMMVRNARKSRGNHAA